MLLRPPHIFQILALVTHCYSFSFVPFTFSKAKAPAKTPNGHSIREQIGTPLLRPVQARKPFPKPSRKSRPTPPLNFQAMFTGIVEEMGSVAQLVADPAGGGVTLKIQCSTVTEGAYLGCSIAVNGVCLTVTDFDRHHFTVAAPPSPPAPRGRF